MGPFKHFGHVYHLLATQAIIHVFFVPAQIPRTNKVEYIIFNFPEKIYMHALEDRYDTLAGDPRLIKPNINSEAEE